MIPLGLRNPGLFALTVLVLNATPGVDLLFTLVATARGGRAAGFAAAAGISLGCVGHALAAAFGLAALLAASSAAFATVKLAGAAYLGWLALGMLRSAMRKAASAGDPEPGSGSAEVAAGATGRAAPSAADNLLAVLRRGAATNLLNPKVALFFLALLPQFIAADAPHKTLSFLALGAWFIAQSAVFLAVFVLLVAPLARRRAPAPLRRLLEAAGGGLFAFLALRLALTER